MTQAHSRFSKLAKLSFGETVIAIPAEDLSFISPVSDLSLQEGNDDFGLLEFGALTHKAFSLDAQLSLTHIACQSSRFGIGLKHMHIDGVMNDAPVRHGVALMVDHLEQFEPHLESNIQDLPALMNEHQTPISLVLIEGEEMLMISTAQRLYEHLNKQVMS